MAVDNLSLVLYKKLDLRLEQRPVPEPGPRDVQVCIHAVGICGTDVGFWQNGSSGSYVVVSPIVMGHEPSGVVTKVGEGVTTLAVGDRVALEPGVPCRVCRYCKTGRYNLCADIKYCATPPDHGTLTRYFVHPEDFCFKLPDHVSFEEGAMLQPLAVAVHACERANIKPGNKVLICGAGPIGILCMLTARARGADKILITDIEKKRLDYASKLGADITVLAEQSQQTADNIQHRLGEGPDITIECSGAPSSVKTAMIATVSGGRIVQVGYGPAQMELPYIGTTSREVDILGMSTIVNNYPAALSMVATGQVDVKQLITHRFKLEQSMEAFQTAFRREGVKIIINCQIE